MTEKHIYYFCISGRRYAVKSVVKMSETEAEKFAAELQKATGKPVAWERK
jgi:hypothetical protein